MNILILGVFGQIGWNLAQFASKAGYTIAGTSNQSSVPVSWPVFRVRLTPQHLRMDLDAVHFKPDVIINCAAYTAVDRAETEARKCLLTNHWACEEITSYARRSKARLIHLSTDYVFDGISGGYTEVSPVAPRGVYGLSKALGEMVVKTYHRATILRFTPLGHAHVLPHHPKSLLDWILSCHSKGQKAPIFANRSSSPISSLDLWNCIDSMLRKDSCPRLLHLWLNETELSVIARQIEQAFHLTPTITHTLLNPSEYRRIRPMRAHLHSLVLEPVHLKESLDSLFQSRSISHR